MLESPSALADPGLALPELGGTPSPLFFEAGDIPAWLESSAWYDLYYLRHEVNPQPPSFEEILQTAGTVQYDLKDAT